MGSLYLVRGISYMGIVKGHQTVKPCIKTLRTEHFTVNYTSIKKIEIKILNELNYICIGGITTNKYSQ